MKRMIRYYVRLGGFVSQAVYRKSFSSLTHAQVFARSLSKKKEISDFPVIVEKYPGNIMAKWMNGKELLRQY